MSAIIDKLADEGNPFGDKVNDLLEGMAAELKASPYESDPGQDALMDDLAQLLDEAFHFQFHDFRNTKYATPKVELRNQLLALADNVAAGRYDNKS
jgi:hypothetical protein